MEIRLSELRSDIDNIFESMSAKLINMARRDKFDIKIIGVIWRIHDHNDKETR